MSGFSYVFKIVESLRCVLNIQLYMKQLHVKCIWSSCKFIQKTIVFLHLKKKGRASGIYVNVDDIYPGVQTELAFPGRGGNQKKGHNLYLLFTFYLVFTFMYLISYKQLFFCFQQQLIFEQDRFHKYLSGVLSDEHWNSIFAVNAGDSDHFFSYHPLCFDMVFLILWSSGRGWS